MTDITVGQVSGAINFAVLVGLSLSRNPKIFPWWPGLAVLMLMLMLISIPFVFRKKKAQITFPLLVVVILVGILNKENTGATW